MNSVSEKIDERILRLLGLRDVFDLDYDTYLNLVREAIVSGSNRLSPEELALLANERKRIRGKKGRFKPKPKKITANNVATTKFLKPSVQPISTPLLPAAAGVQASQAQPADLSPLQRPLDSIKKILSSFLNFREDASDKERRDYEAQRRSKREAGLEGLKKGMGAVADATKKFVAPFQSIIDRIWRFIFFTLLGRAFTQLMNWFGDPKNKKKVDTLKRFIKDWWPSLLGAFTLFFTPFGKFVRGILGIVGGLTGKLIGAIPKIAGAVKGLSRVLLNPWVAVPAAAVGLAAAANEVTGQRKAAPVQAENKARAQTGKGLGVQGVGGVGDMGSTTPYGLLQGAARGGSVLNGYSGINRNTGQSITGFGPDTQLIAAQPGEVVINKRTVDAVGADTFLSLNRYYGGSGANQPRFGRLFNSGGVVGGLSNWYNRGRNVRIPNESQATWRQLIRDDVLQRGQYQTPSGLRGWNPWWSFTKGLGTGPTPLGRQAIERGIPRLGLYQGLSQIQGSTPQSGPAYQRAQKARGLATARYAARTGQFGRYQGGGEVMGSITPEEGLRGYEMARKKKELPTWMIEALGKEVYDAKYGPAVTGGAGPWRNFKGSGASNMRGEPLSRKGGGLIGEGTGMNIRGATADRQLTALQPGEYVLPVDTVNRLGTSLVDKLVAMTDSNSTPAKLGKRSITRPQITPLRRGQSNVITLPPITQSSGGSGGAKYGAGSKVPAFSASSPSGSGERSMNASIYGIVG